MALRSSWRVRAIFGRYAQCLLKVGEVGERWIRRRLGRQWIRGVYERCREVKEKELMLLWIESDETMRR